MAGHPFGTQLRKVYDARDTRLNRRVAVKIASEEFSERFEREARVTAAFSQPKYVPALRN